MIKTSQSYSYSNTIYNLNWREKRLVPGYYGCGKCDLCRCSIFGDKFKVQYTNHWFKIQGEHILFKRDKVDQASLYRFIGL